MAVIISLAFELRRGIESPGVRNCYCVISMRTIVFLLLVSSLSAQYQRRPKPTGRPGSDLDILNTAVASFDGTLRSLDKKQVLLEMGEEQTVSIEVNKKTLYFRGTEAIAPRDVTIGAIVTVEAKKIANQLVAVSVRVKEPPPPAKP